MTPEEKIAKIQELEVKFLAQIEEIKKEYQLKIKDVLTAVNKEKIESLKKDLGI